jgi:hypothetical protein
MEQILPQAIRQFLKLLVVLFFSTSIKAQISIPYQIGSIGTMGTANPVFSGPVLISGADCFLLSNGIKTFELPQIGYFSTACRLMLMSDPGFRLTAFPNPIISTVTIKTSEQVKPLNDNSIQLQLLDISGRLIQTFHTDIKGLNIGYQIQMSSLSNGSYFIKVASGSINYQVLSIIKSN